jgi:hypothetical protein
MKIKYTGTQRIISLKESLSYIFSIHYYDGDETPKGLNIIFFGREWYWDIGEWSENDL